MSVFNFWLNELNQQSFKKYRKYTIILGVGSLALKLITEFPFFEIVFLVTSIFLIVISIKSLSDEKFRLLVLNGKNEFENQCGFNILRNQKWINYLMHFLKSVSLNIIAICKTKADSSPFLNTVKCS